MANNRELSQFASFVEVGISSIGFTTSVGIGTTNPQFDLDVAGDINFTGTFYQGGTQFIASRWSATGSDIYRLSKVGINTSIVPSALTVNGDVSVSGVVTATSFIGAVTGTATSTTNIPNLTGDITSVNSVTSIAAGVIVDADINASAAIVDTKLATIATALKVSNSATTATNANTASAIVARDASGNFSAGTITASLTGTASSTTNIPNLTGAITSNNTTTSLGSFSSANLATALTDETGSGAAVFATSPTLVTPVLGAASATSINASGIITATTFVGALTGTASNVTTNANLTGHVTSVGNAAVLGSFTSLQLLTALTDETGSGAAVFATSPTLVTPVLGTPQSGTLTSCTGLPISTGISGLGANVATFLATPSSSNLASAVTDETGTGALVFATSPTLVTPVLGAATATSVTASGAITANSYNIGTSAGISTTITTVATTTATSIDTFAVADYRSSKMQIQITQGTDYQASDVLVIHNGITANIIEYGSIATNNYLGNFSADISGANARLLVTMSSASSSTVKVLSQRITI